MKILIFLASVVMKNHVKSTQGYPEVHYSVMEME